jgi:hypothetical protein
VQGYIFNQEVSRYDECSPKWEWTLWKFLKFI